MRTTRLLPILLSCLLIGPMLIAQDRAPSRNVIYPEAAFARFNPDTTRIAGSGRVIDVTRPPFNAAGNGVTDDTEAINAAYTYLAEELQQFGWSTDSNEGSYLLYFPNGTYLVSNTIIHNLGNIIYTVGSESGPDGPQGVSWVRLVGQNRDNTIIKLKDNCPGFEAGSEKEVVSFQKKGLGRNDGNNIPAANQISDITINIGSGNPGAIGMFYVSANTGEMSNVLIKSEDGQGYAGIDFPVFSVQGHYRDITIDGFDHGIRATTRGENNPTLEYLTLQNQNIAGVLVIDGAPNMRRVLSTNSGPFMTITPSVNASVVLIDSDLRGGDANTPAIDLQGDGAQLFVRNTQVNGYGVSIQKEGEAAVTGYIDEYVADEVYTLFEGFPKRSLNLPIEESPLLEWEQDTSQWANVDAYPGANDSERIQAAMNSGKPVVYFPQSSYNLTTPVTIPPTVRHLDALYTRFNSNGEFIISQGSSELLFIDHINRNQSTLTQSASRPVAIRNATFGVYRYTGAEPSELFLESAGALGSEADFCPPPLSIWARSINNEPKGESNILINGGTMWTMGFKTESVRTVFEVNGGGTVEVLGGLHNQATNSSRDPLVINNNSNVSFIGYTHLAGPADTVATDPVVTETQNGVTLTLVRSDVPPRGSRAVFVPLYVGTTEATGAVCLPPINLASATTPGSVTLSWRGRGSSIGSYDIRYRVLGATDWQTITGLSDTTTTLTNLAEGVNYEWEARTNCSAEEVSEWSATAQFITDLGVRRVGSPPVIDGRPNEDAWSLSTTANKAVSGTVDNDVTFGLLWDNQYLYIGAEILDDSLFNDSENVFQDDAVEVYLDVNNNGGPYDAGDAQFILGYNDNALFISRAFSDSVLFGTADIAGGYSAELAIPWSGLGVVPGSNVTIGFDLGVNDDDDGGDDREAQQVWTGDGSNFNNTSNFGDITLQDTLETASELRLNFTWDGVTADSVIGLESSFSDLASFSDDAAFGSNSVEVMGNDSLLADNPAIGIARGSLLNDAFVTRSYSLWVKARDTDPQQILFEEGGDGGGAAFQLEDDSLLVLFRSGSGVTTDIATVKVPFVDSDTLVDWTHLAVTYEAGIIGVYVNGALVGSAASSASTIPRHNNPPSLGGIRNDQSPTNDNGFYLNGFLDEFRVYDGVLTPEEIAELADRPIVGPPAELALYFPWDGTIADSVTGLESSLDSTLAVFSPETPFGTNSIEVLSNDGLANGPAVAIDNGSLLNDSFDFRSYSLWARARNTTPKQILFEEGGSLGGAVIELESGNLTALFRYGGSEATLATVPFPDSGDWTHVAVTYEAGVITVYINGEEAGSAVSETVSIPNHNNPPSLGGVRGNQTSSVGDGFYFDGFLDELKVFTGVLTAEEIAELADIPTPEDTAALALYWPLEVTEGSVVEDLAGPVISNGTIIGGTAADLTSEGIVGNSFEFDPTSPTEGPTVSLSENVIRDFPFSVTAWVNPDGSQFSQVFTLADSTTNRNYVAVGITDLTLEDGTEGTQAFILADDNQGTNERANTTINIREGWHHLALVVESATSRKLYVDGELAVEDSAEVSGLTFANQRLTLGSGRRGGFDGNRYRGKVDEFKLYRIAIPEDSIEAMRVAPTSLTLAEDSIALPLDSTGAVPAVNLTPTFSRADLLYASSDDEIVAVDNNGLLSGLALGEAYVTVRSAANPGAVDSVLVSVGAILGDCSFVLADFFGAAEIVDVQEVTYADFGGKQKKCKKKKCDHKKCKENTFVVGVATGIREDGLAGAWEIHNDCSVKPLLRSGKKKEVTLLPDIDGIERKRNWRYVPDYISEDGQYIYATAINSEGFVSKKGITVEPGTVLNIRFRLGKPLKGRIARVTGEILCDNLEATKKSTDYLVIRCNDAATNARQLTNDSNKDLRENMGQQYKVRIYPNPVTDVLRLQGLEVLDAGIEVRILTLAGKQLIYQNVDQRREVDVTHLPAGMYIIDVQSAVGSRMRTKLIKR